MSKHTKAAAILLLSGFGLAGCDWGDWYAPGDGFVDEAPTIACAEIRNSDEAACAALPEADEDAAAPHLDLDVATVVLDAGTVYRGSALDVLIELENSGDSIWNGHVSATFDAGCTDTDDTDVLPVRAVTLSGGGTYSRQITTTCTEMPLGARILTIQLHDPDPEDVLEQTVILFELEDGEPPE